MGGGSVADKGVAMTTGQVSRRDDWGLRAVSEETAAAYRAAGHWRGESLGQVVANGLAEMGSAEFRVLSAFRPWSGTFVDVDRAARRFAASLRARGVGPGDVVLIQLPNWVEAGIAFWAATYLGAVVVPVVHFYGAKEVGYIVEATDPAVVIGAASFGKLDPLGTHAAVMERHPVENWLVVGEDTPLPPGATPFADLLDADPIAGPAEVDPSSPALIGFTSGTTQNPKGVVHSHDTLGFEARQLSDRFPDGGPPQITGAPVGHFIGMLNAFLTPLLKWRPVNLVDVWDPTEILRLMSEEGLGLTGGATYFLTSILDHPDFGEEHLAMMPFAGLGGSPVPALSPSGRRPWASGRSGRTAARSTRPSPGAGSTNRPRSVSTPTDVRCRAWRSASTTTARS